MTYWPISAPSVYAASKQQLSKRNIRTSYDGLEEHSSTGRTNRLSTQHEDASEKESSVEETNVSSVNIDATKASEPSVHPGPERSPVNGEPDIAGEIIGLRVTRNGHIFSTITDSTLTIWQTKPTAILASVLRSKQSLKTYGPNVNLLLRPDSAIFVVQTSLGYLITYSLASDPTARVYKPQFPLNSVHNRRHSISGYKAGSNTESMVGPGEGGGLREISLRFRMVIKVDAGIAKALALDEELIVATERPAAIQCIRWAPDNAGSQTSTELLSRMQWLGNKVTISDMVYDRPMNLSTWVTNEGKAFAVQRLSPENGHDTKKRSLFNGYAFHVPENDGDIAVKAAINARFSLIAVGCKCGYIYVYTARDYTGNIPLSHRLMPGASSSTTGALTFLSWSPDGYCIFAGYEKGWMMWSVFGKPGANSFTSDRALSEKTEEGWLLGIRDGFWVGGGSQLMLLSPNDNRLWMLEMARSAVAGCFSSANVARSLLQTNTGFMIYRGYDLPDMTAISADTSLWHHVQVPAAYLADQWPIRSAVISSDGRYVAVAGRRGLAHYSVNSGRWKTFDDTSKENEFTVRGGMCWHQHVLIVATESSEAHEIRTYSREASLDDSNAVQVERLAAPIVLIAPSGDDSLLVYTYENILYHFIINITNSSVKLVQVGQIALHGIIRAPPRVRALSWILPENQLQNGDPSQDVSVASILFLVDGKLVLLQPAATDSGELKYEMRIVAQNVEYYTLMRDQPSFTVVEQEGLPPSPGTEVATSGIHTYQGHDLRDSLWFFDGHDVRLWIDIQDVLITAPLDTSRDLTGAVKITVDFYPLSTLLNKGILFGLESDLVQRRDGTFAFLRFATRTHLFIPPLLRHHLSHFDSPAALHLSHHYAHLAYFPHALEILLHDVLDEEVDAPSQSEHALLPNVLSFLSSFPQYLDIVVQCTRKTEVRSWRTLFDHLPPPQELFEESLQHGSLKTAGGYLLVLHTFDEISSSSFHSVRLLRRAKEEQDWELCKELARFLMALDETGATLRDALASVDLPSPPAGAQSFTGREHLNASLVLRPRPKRNGSGRLDRQFSFPNSADGSASDTSTGRSGSPGSMALVTNIENT
ncbi:RIC1-domain-containing protein [Pseudovirgaria hyperparasitica]|uniref:RIC1-domain-containing protein n=1 Tax=Pseudovirgaria hyperparasitica TaxID=470096 RepID=A0A6A6WK06_9PEZI|nr:RIC1-domain-containing protein [Pseudovirgaria hyperparasitica]KAF2762031.1 RIC1-domain-containing protein [Pseudovirgaria hyperparasitica]